MALSIKAMKQPVKMPIVMKSCWKTPKKPDNSKGTVSFIIRGTTALNMPAHIPCPNLRSI